LRALHEALDNLAGPERRAIELTFMQELSHAEVAAAMNAPLGTVEGWIRRGLARLRSEREPA
jgi:RNA polymerase sigma-70 factor (ECF subfamily)